MDQFFFIPRESTPVGVGDVVHLEGRPDAGSWLVDRDQGFLVLLPDSLISGTSISSAIRCMRRAVLGDLFKVSLVPFYFHLGPYLFPACVALPSQRSFDPVLFFPVDRASMAAPSRC